jgi:phosphatidylserine decarboxylase
MFYLSFTVSVKIARKVDKYSEHRTSICRPRHRKRLRRATFWRLDRELFYAQEREQAFVVFNLLASRSFSRFLGWLNYDFPLGQNLAGGKRFLERCAVDLSECAEPLGDLDSARKIFERKIRYWQCRPMSEADEDVVCPGDSRVLFGSLRESSRLFLKGKFFDYEELLGFDKPRHDLPPDP